MPRHEDTLSAESVGDEFRRIWGLPPRDPNAPSVVAPAPDVSAIIREQRREAFARFCPEEFRKPIVREKIANLAAWDVADRWQGDFPGVWIWSHETGQAKTRFLWRKFGQLHCERGLSVVRVSGLELAEDYADAWRAGRTFQFYERFRRIGAVMLDDLHNMELPEDGQAFGAEERSNRNARMLRELFDDFYENHTRVLVTANEDIAWFGERIGPSGERRMREVCSAVHF